MPGLILFAVVLFALQPFLHFHLHKHLRSKAKHSYTLMWIGLALFLSPLWRLLRRGLRLPDAGFSGLHQPA